MQPGFEPFWQPWHLEILVGQTNIHHYILTQFFSNKKPGTANTQMTHIQVQNWKKLCYLCLLNTQQYKKYTLLDLFNDCNNHTTYKNLKKQFAVYDSDTLWPRNRDQGHPPWKDLVDPKQGYNHAKIVKPHSTSHCKKVNVKVFVKSGNTSIISLEYIHTSKTSDLLDVFNNPMKFKLHRVRANNFS